MLDKSQRTGRILEDNANWYRELHTVTFYFVSGQVRTWKVTDDELDSIFDYALRFKVPNDDDVINVARIDPFTSFEYWILTEQSTLKAKSIFINLDTIETIE